jgi:ribosomal protein L40E
MKKQSATVHSKTTFDHTDCCTINTDELSTNLLWCGCVVHSSCNYKCGHANARVRTTLGNVCLRCYAHTTDTILCQKCVQTKLRALRHQVHTGLVITIQPQTTRGARMRMINARFMEHALLDPEMCAGPTDLSVKSRFRDIAQIIGAGQTTVPKSLVSLGPKAAAIAVSFLRFTEQRSALGIKLTNNQWMPCKDTFDLNSRISTAGYVGVSMSELCLDTRVTPAALLELIKAGTVILSEDQSCVFHKSVYDKQPLRAKTTKRQRTFLE